MTTIFWDGKSKTLFADSRTTYGGGPRETIVDGKLKIVTFDKKDHLPWDNNDQRILAMAGCGAVIAIEFLIESMIQYGSSIADRMNDIPNSNVIYNGSVGATVLVVTTGGVYRVDYDMDCDGPIRMGRSCQLHKQLVVGSGARFVEMATKVFSLPSATAMRFARIADKSSGGMIDSFTLKDDGQFVKNEPIPLVCPNDDFNFIKDAITALPSRKVNEKQRNLYGGSATIERSAKERTKQTKPRHRVPVEQML